MQRVGPWVSELESKMGIHLQLSTEAYIYIYIYIYKFKTSCLAISQVTESTNACHFVILSHLSFAFRNYVLNTIILDLHYNLTQTNGRKV